jgi:anti-sigma factor RsiW
VVREFGRLFGGHRPDVEALSARLDGQLPPGRDREIDEHVATCAACQTAFEELRLTAAIVRAMPEAETRRSFRLRASDIAAAPAKPVRYGGGLMRWAPAVSGAAILVLVVTAGMNRATDGGSGGGGDSLAASRETDTPAGMLAADDGAASPGGDAGAAAPDADRAARDRTEPAVEGYAPPAETPVPADAAGGTVVASERVAGEPTPSFGTGAETQFDDGTSAAESFAPPVTETTPVTGMVPAPGAPEGEQAQRTSEADEDGNQTGFLIVEVLAAIVAIAAAAGYVAWRITRGGVPG